MILELDKNREFKSQLGQDQCQNCYDNHYRHNVYAVLMLVSVAKCTSYSVSVLHTRSLARYLLTSAATGYPVDTCMCIICFTLRAFCANRRFAGSSHMVRNKLCWDANMVGVSLFWKSHCIACVPV